MIAAAVACVATGVGVAFRGDAGVGKSRLLAEVAARLNRAGVSVTALHATASTASIPLGVFLSVLGPAENQLQSLADPSAPASVALLRLAAVIRSRLLAASPTVIGVDDAHLLDAPSAGLLLELARSGAIVLLTLREGERVPDAVTALWRDGLVTIENVGALDANACHELVAQLLGGPVDRGLSRAVCVKSGGNPLFACEIVRSLGGSGVASLRAGVWTLVDSLPPLPHVTDYLAVRIDELEPDVREIAEVVAVAGSLGVQEAEALVGDSTIERAESTGLVCTLRDGGRTVVRLSHPLYVDALLAGLSPLRRTRISRQLGDALEARTRGRALSVAERVDAATWRLAAGTSVPADELVSLAEIVYPSDPALSNRFVAAALEAPRDVAQSLRLVMLLMHLHRRDDADALLTTLDGVELSASARAVAVASRAYLLGIVGHRPDLSLDVIDAAMRDLGAMPQLLAIRTNVLWQLGRFDDAVALGRPLFFDESLAITERVLTGSVLSIISISSARREQYLDYRDQLAPLVPQAHAMPEAEDTMRLQGVLAALNLDQDLESAGRLARDGYERSLLRGNDSARTEFAHLVAWVKVQGGDLAGAMTLFAEVNAAAGMWSHTTRPWTRSHVVRALVLDGRLAEARVVLGRIHAEPHAPVHDVSVALAEASVLAADGALLEGARRCHAAADAASALGQHERARAAWFAGLRYGDATCAHQLERELASAPGEIDTAKVSLARAWINSDAPSAESAATSFAARGLLWYAIDAQAMAVDIHHTTGQPGALPTARLAALRRRAHGLTSPTVRFLAAANTAEADVLTSRELEIALLAARGHSDRSIADALGISVRTVSTHLGHVYTKLGVNKRSQLAVALDDGTAEHY